MGSVSKLSCTQQEPIDGALGEPVRDGSAGLLEGLAAVRTLVVEGIRFVSGAVSG